MDIQKNGNGIKHFPDSVDVIIVGAGFAGLFMLHELRERGYSTKVFEAADGVGGTWYWNRYPGARCDVESMQYSYSFSEKLQQEWHWSERYASQPEILRYLNHVADRFDLWKDIQLGTRVISAIFDDNLLQWVIETDRGDRLSAKFCVMATGSLSIPKNPDIKGIDRFKGNIYRTSKWPSEDVSFTDRRVAVIGTGSSGIQCIPIIAKQAAQVYVFQRTPNFSVPLKNKPMDAKYEKSWKSKYEQFRYDMLDNATGTLLSIDYDPSSLNMTPEEQHEAGWQQGGLAFFSSFEDLYTNEQNNNKASNFIRAKIRATVKDPAVAEALLPYDHFFCVKRPCMDSQYYETFNRNNVTLVDIRKKCIDEITPTGIVVEGKNYEVDDIVLAIGFDAFTGAMLNIDIRGRSGTTLRDKWTKRADAYLGMMIVGFPNLFTMTGPGSPAELTNMVPHIEENVKWITKCIEHLKTHSIDSIEPTVAAESAWMEHVDAIASETIFATGNSWYNGANIPGKPRTFMLYVGGFYSYLRSCEQAHLYDYEDFILSTRSSLLSAATK